MQVDLHEFLARFIGTIAATLVPVALIAFTTMPMSLHHHIGTLAPGTDAVAQHMT
jgi:hypothetical protein